MLVKKKQKYLYIEKEEWFKVFIHETFHSLCLDFSMITISNLNKKIKNIFPIDINLIYMRLILSFGLRFLTLCFVVFL